MIQRIISGGQTGVDRGALEAALELGLAIGGHIPRGGRAEDGVIPDRFREHMWETKSSGYAERTELNVIHASATLLITRERYNTGPGTRLTLKHTRAYGVPSFWAVLSEQPLPDVVRWLVELGPARTILNVAGTRESRCPGIQAATRDLLIRALR